MTDRPEPANRRSGERRFAGVKAMVTHDQLGLTKCKLRDISLDGAFIETGTLVLSKNADVDLVLKIRAGARNRHCRFQAKVTRVTAEGAVLEFRHLSESEYRTLFDIVHEE